MTDFDLKKSRRILKLQGLPTRPSYGPLSHEVGVLGTETSVLSYQIEVTISAPSAPAENPTLWFDGEDLDGSGNTLLTPDQSLGTVPNKGTYGGNLTAQTTPYPVYRAGVLNGKDGLQWEAQSLGTKHLQGAALSNYITSTTWEVFTVAQVDLWTDPGQDYWGPAIVQANGGYWSLSVTDIGGGANRYSGYFWDGDAEYARVAAATSTAELVHWRADGQSPPTQYISKNNGTPVSNPANAGVTNVTGFVGLAFGYNNFELDGYIYEVLIYNRVLTDDERTQNVEYLQAKWGI